MRDYSKVSPRFWTGDTGKVIRHLGRDCQVIAFYLFTCPSANMLGLYYLAMPTLCHETGSPFKGALKALRSLQEVNFAYYDLPSEQVYVPNMAREQIGDRLERRDNRHKAVLRELQHLRKTPFFNDFIIRYREPFELHDVQIEPVSASPSGGPSKPLLKPLRSQEQEQEQEQEQDQKQEQEQEQEQEGERGNGNARAKRSPATRIPEDFGLSDERRAYAQAHGLDAEATFALFSTYWRAKSGAGATKIDWDATWQHWCLKDQQRNRPKKTRFQEIQDMRNAS